MFEIYNYKINNMSYIWNKVIFTERGGSVVTHETRIREIPGSKSRRRPTCLRFLMVSSILK